MYRYAQVLGFGHPDEFAATNFEAQPGCLINNATCRDPFSCGRTAPYGTTVNSIMHSITQTSKETCLYQVPAA